VREERLLPGGAARVGVLGGGGERHGGWEEQVADARGEAAGGAGEWGWRLYCGHRIRIGFLLLGVPTRVWNTLLASLDR
jgi:hypothetical protein